MGHFIFNGPIGQLMSSGFQDAATSVPNDLLFLRQLNSNIDSQNIDV
jgi:hypothetical protein